MTWLNERAPYQAPEPADVCTTNMMVALSRIRDSADDDQVVIISSCEIDGVERRVLGYFTPEIALDFAAAVTLAAREIGMSR